MIYIFFLILYTILSLIVHEFFNRLIVVTIISISNDPINSNGYKSPFLKKKKLRIISKIVTNSCHYIIHRIREFLCPRLNDSSKCVNVIKCDRSIQTIFVPFLKYATTKMQQEKSWNRHVRDYRFVSLNNTIINEIQDAETSNIIWIITRMRGLQFILNFKRETIIENRLLKIHRSLINLINLYTLYPSSNISNQFQQNQYLYDKNLTKEVIKTGSPKPIIILKRFILHPFHRKGEAYQILRPTFNVR